ncbi:TPA: RNA-directed DNA polymerase, partial [Streptococcus suis]
IEYRSSRHSEKLNNILNYLSKYNDKLMIDITGNIKGVPQGPAYSRVLAEFFLSTVLEEFSEEYRKKNSKVNFKIYRYVDDMYIIYQNLQDGDMFLEALTEHLSKVGLSINQEKTKNFGKIGNLSDSEKKDFFEESYLSYLIQDFEDLTYLSDEEHQEIYSFFEKYLERNGKWNIKDANFLLGNYIDETLLEFYISKYYHFILTSKYGRGSIFTKFYKYVFKKSDLVKKFFMNRDYESVPKDSLNFESLISTLFFEIDFVKEVLMNDGLIEECLQYLQSNVNVESNAFKTINVLKERVINDDTGY